MDKFKVYAGCIMDEGAVEACQGMVLSGADGVILLDQSGEDENKHEAFFGALRALKRLVDVPVFAGGRSRRLEDVKKYLYAGASAVLLFPEEAELDGGLSAAAGKRFGADRIFLVQEESRGGVMHAVPADGKGISGGTVVICPMGDCAPCTSGRAAEPAPEKPSTEKPKAAETAAKDLAAVIGKEQDAAAAALLAWSPKTQLPDFMEVKQSLIECGITTEVLTAAFSWQDVKTDPQGLLPVVVQDYKNLEVLMVAYMNEEAFEKTLRTGRMTYYSRSRKELWLKGETSGHFQFVKSLTLDCDRDTLLAKVFQVGAACHTGNRSCFFQEVASLPGQSRNPHRVLEDVYQVILDRKAHPKEGSYTNYLFDQGIDKILKKVGEEASEIIIAAKNPDPEEVKYEISDFLYHAMVLMAEKHVTWDDIMEELANR